MEQTHELWLRISPLPATPAPALIQPFNMRNMRSEAFVLHARVRARECVCVLHVSPGDAGLLSALRLASWLPSFLCNPSDRREAHTPALAPTRST